MWLNHRPGGQSAALLLRVGIQDAEVVHTFCDRLRDGTRPYLLYFDSADFDTTSPLLRYHSGKYAIRNTPDDGLNIVEGINVNSGSTKREHNLNNDLNEMRLNYLAYYDLSILGGDGHEVPEPWLIDLLRERLAAGTAKEIVSSARTLAKLKVKSPFIREILQRRLNEVPVRNKSQPSFTSDTEQQSFDEISVVLAAAHSLFMSGINDGDVLQALHARLEETHNKTHFWLVVDFCLRHQIKDPWLTNTLLNKLRNGPPSDSETAGQVYSEPEQEESALAAAALIQLRVRNINLLTWVISRLDMPETASKAAEDLGEFGGLDNRLVTGALIQRLNLEMDQGDEGDISLLSATASSLVKLGEHTQVVLRALRRSIEKAGGIEGGKQISQSAKALHSINELDQQTVALLRKRLDDKDLGVGKAVAKVLADFDVRDKVTQEKLREQLDVLDSNVEKEATYAKLVLLHPERKFEGELEQLLEELLSPAADSSIGYRRAVQYAFKLLAEQQLTEKGGGMKAIDSLRAKLSELYNDHTIHRQIAAYDILRNIDEVVEEHKQEGSY